MQPIRIILLLIAIVVLALTASSALAQSSTASVTITKRENTPDSVAFFRWRWVNLVNVQSIKCSLDGEDLRECEGRNYELQTDIRPGEHQFRVEVCGIELDENRNGSDKCVEDTYIWTISKPVVEEETPITEEAPITEEETPITEEPSAGCVAPTPLAPPGWECDDMIGVPNDKLGFQTWTSLRLLAPNRLRIDSKGNYQLEAKCGTRDTRYVECSSYVRVYEMRPHKHKDGKIQYHNGRMLDKFSFDRFDFGTPAGEQFRGGEKFAIDRKAFYWQRSGSFFHKRYGKFMRVRAYVWEDSSRKDRTHYVDDVINTPKPR
jgi:hypothetical protein